MAKKGVKAKKNIIVGLRASVKIGDELKKIQREINRTEFQLMDMKFELNQAIRHGASPSRMNALRTNVGSRESYLRELLIRKLAILRDK